jgi:uncharacterized protein YihD (DUF1040 family)
MRDKKRIDIVLSKIKTIWEKYPDLRLGQLILNVVRDTNSHVLYYLEDDELLKKLIEEYLND